MTQRLVRVEFRAMGTTCAAAVTARSGEEPAARRALVAARREIETCERVLSRFDRRSDLSRLNAAGGRWTRVDARLLEALELALAARAETSGLFDPTVLPALAAAGYDRSFELIVDRPPRPVAGWRPGAAVEIDRARRRVLLEPGTAVDLGGIGKGYSAARALRAMRAGRPSLRGALVDLGGDLAVEGEPPEAGPWRIAVADPRRPGATLATLLVRSGGVATSGRDVRRFGPGKTLHHLIDPTTGAPARPGPVAVTVVAPAAAEAEAHATALAMMSPVDAAAHVAARPRLSAVYVPGSGSPLRLGAPPVAVARLLVSAA